MFREHSTDGQTGNSGMLEQMLEKPLHGKALRHYIGWPEWFLESQDLLRNKWRIKGEGQAAVAKAVPPQEMEEAYRSAYSRLSPILMLDTASFIKAVPQVLTYRNSHIESYIKKLRQVVEILYSKFGYDLPEHVHWVKNPRLFATRESLEELEARLKQVNLAAAKEARLLEEIERTGYNPVLVSTIIQKGFKIYSSNSFIGGNGIPYRHARANTWRGKVSEKDMDDFEETFHKLIQSKMILVDKTTGNGGRFTYKYSINSHPTEVSNHALRAYLSYVFEKREATRK